MRLLQRYIVSLQFVKDVVVVKKCDAVRRCEFIGLVYPRADFSSGRRFTLS